MYYVLGATEKIMTTAKIFLQLLNAFYAKRN